MEMKRKGEKLELFFLPTSSILVARTQLRYRETLIELIHFLVWVESWLRVDLKTYNWADTIFCGAVSMLKTSSFCRNA